jgi:RNA polymerase sigma factor (sigma-70 family)
VRLDGDESAWRAIVRAYSPLVRSVCRRHGFGGAVAEDICATVWLRLVGRVGTIREPAALTGWLATSARRGCLRHMRNRKREHLTAELRETVATTVPCAVLGMPVCAIGPTRQRCLTRMRRSPALSTLLRSQP